MSNNILVSNLQEAINLLKEGKSVPYKDRPSSPSYMYAGMYSDREDRRECNEYNSKQRDLYNKAYILYLASNYTLEDLWKQQKIDREFEVKKERILERIDDAKAALGSREKELRDLYNAQTDPFHIGESV